MYFINYYNPRIKFQKLKVKMSTYIDFRTLPANVPSLCIPRVFVNVDERRIRRVLDDLNLGVIERVDIINKTTEKGEKSNRVFIHFRHWFNNKNANTSRERLLNGKEIKIIYDDPWFWKVSAYRETSKPSKKVMKYNNSGEKKRATIQFDPDDTNEPPQPKLEPEPVQKQVVRRPVLPQARNSCNWECDIDDYAEYLYNCIRKYYEQERAEKIVGMCVDFNWDQLHELATNHVALKKFADEANEMLEADAAKAQIMSNKTFAEDNEPQRQHVIPSDDRRQSRVGKPIRPTSRHYDVRTKYDREKHVNLVQQNVHKLRSPSSSHPITRNEEQIIEEQFISKCHQDAIKHKSHYESQMSVSHAVVYDMSFVNSTKKRHIVVKNDISQPVIKVDIKQESGNDL